MEEKKNYYAIIPANVRYDKDLTSNAKLLYGEISALCNDKGYCWSTNKYFADLYGVSQTSISKWVSSLLGKGYIFSRIVYREGTKEILERRLSIVKEPIEEKLNTPIEENFKENSTSLNSTVNNPPIPPKGNEERKESQSELMERFEIFYKAYPRHKSRGDAEKAWKSIKPSKALFAKIMEALELAKQNPDWQKENHKYAPYPASWLRATGWEDEGCVEEPKEAVVEKKGDYLW